jgi:hypothetical protein
MVVIYLLEKKNNRMAVLHNSSTDTTVFKTSLGVISKHPDHLKVFIDKLAFILLRLKVTHIGLVFNGRFSRAYYRFHRDLGPKIVFSLNHNVFAYNGCRFCVTRRV